MPSKRWWVLSFLCLIAVSPLIVANSQNTTASRPEEPRIEYVDDALPKGAIARLGTFRFWHGGKVGCVAISLDGKMVASGGTDRPLLWRSLYNPKAADKSRFDRRVIIWDVATGRKLRELQHPDDAIRCLAFSPDGRSIAVGCGKLIIVWSVESGEELFRITENKWHVSFVSFTSNGKTLVSGIWDDGIVLFSDAVTGKVRRRLDAWGREDEAVDKGEKPDQHVDCLWFSQQGQSLGFLVQNNDRRTPERTVFSPYKDEAYIRVLDAISGKKLFAINSVKADTHQAIVSQDGTRLVTCTNGDGAGVQILNAATGKLVRELENSGKECEQITLSRDGRTLASQGANRLSIWDMESGVRLHMRTCPRTTNSGFDRLASLMTFSADGSKLVVAIEDAVHIWDVRSMRESPVSSDNSGEAKKLRFSPAGDTLVVNSYLRSNCWDTTTWKELARTNAYGTLMPDPSDEQVHDLTLDGQKYLSYCAGGIEARVRDTKTGKLLSRLPIRAGFGIESGLFLTDDKQVFLCGAPKLEILPRGAWIFDATSGKKVLELDDMGILSPTLSADGSSLCWYQPSSRELHVLDIGSKELIRSFISPEGKQDFAWRNHAFSPNAQLIAFADLGEQTGTGADAAVPVHLSEIKTGREFSPIAIKASDDWTNRIAALALSADHRLLAVSLQDSPNVRLYETGSGMERHRITGHRDAVLALAFSPDGRFLASGSKDSTTLIWDLHNLSGVTPGKEKLSAKALSALWEDLGAKDPSNVGKAIQAMFAAPEQAVDFLKAKLKPVSTKAPDPIARLIAELDSDDFKTREIATAELAAMGEHIEFHLRQAMADESSLEARRRLQMLLRPLGKSVPLPETLRELRAIEVLEYAATPEARSLLQTLAEGASESRVTQAAKESVGRLAKVRRPKN